MSNRIHLHTRRDFLHRALLCSISMLLARGAEASPATPYKPPVRLRGKAHVGVRDFGAMGDGIHDDTSAFERAIGALPADGGTVNVGSGTYLIDALRAVKLRSRMHLAMAPGARLVAKPNASKSSRVLFIDSVNEVEISGGEIVGEREKHLGTEGEWGHGIKVKGAERVTIRDIHISKCWGDGIVVGPKPVRRAPYVMSRDVVVANVVCTGNRRQGLSIGNVIGMRVQSCEFSFTHGTSPQCGIDVEPDKDFDGRGFCDQVHIEDCLVRGNAVYGINVWKRTRNVTVLRCRIEENKSCGLVTRGLAGGRIASNTFRDNGSTGLFLQEGTVDCEVSGNVFQGNYAKRGRQKRTPVVIQGALPEVRKDMIVGTGTARVRVGPNHYR